MSAAARETSSSRSTLPSFSLLPGERLLASGAPEARLTRQLDAAAWLAVLCTVGLLLPLLPLVLWANRAWQRRHRYWLTDRRLVVQTGIIGQSLRSVPLSRVADVEVRASWFDRLFGLQHVVVRDMTGEVSSGGISAGFRMAAVADAAGWAERVLALAGQGGPTDAGGLSDPGAATLAVLERIAATLDELRDAA